MADSPSRPDAVGQEPGPAAHPGMPRWAKSLAIAGAALLVAFVLMHAIGGGMGGH